MTIDRRQFLGQALTLSGVTFLGFRLTGCGPAADSAVRDGAAAAYDGPTVTMYDIQMEGWSIYTGTKNGDDGILEAKTIQDAKEVTLTYVQDPHGHKFTITKDHFKALRRGELVKIITTEAQGHQHEVRIDPKNKARGNNPGLSMPVDPDATPGTGGTGGTGTTPPPPPPPPSEKLYAAFNENDRPNLYVSGSKELQDGSVELCWETKDKCKADASLWRKLKVHKAEAGRQVFVSEGDLQLDLNRAEYPMQVRAKTKDGVTLIEQALKLLKR